jgi:hypothetical protein
MTNRPPLLRPLLWLQRPRLSLRRCQLEMQRNRPLRCHRPLRQPWPLCLFRHRLRSTRLQAAWTSASSRQTQTMTSPRRLRPALSLRLPRLRRRDRLHA